MINISIDTSDLAAEFELSKDERDGMMSYAIEEISSSFARKWDNEAKQKLTKSKNQYRSAIQVRKVDQFTTAVYLNPASWLANAIEMGKGGYDMKPGFLSSSKVKYTSKGTPYLTIPLRFGGSESIGDNSAFAGVLPQAIQTIVKKQPKNSSGNTKGLSLGQIPKEYQIPKSSTLRKQLKSKGFNQLTNRNVPKTSLYEGLSKRGGGYVVFRRVTPNTAQDKWQHPGFEPKNLAESALNKLNVDMIVDTSIDNYLNALGF